MKIKNRQEFLVVLTLAVVALSVARQLHFPAHARLVVRPAEANPRTARPASRRAVK